MLTKDEFNELSARLDGLSCSDPKAGDGLFTFVLTGEPTEQRLAYEQHIERCEYCRIALQTYRYKRDAMKLLNKWEEGKKIISLSASSNSRILKRQLGAVTAYFQPGEIKERGTTVVVDSLGDLLLVEEQSIEEFQLLKDAATGGWQ